MSGYAESRIPVGCCRPCRKKGVETHRRQVLSVSGYRNTNPEKSILGYVQFTVKCPDCGEEEELWDFWEPELYGDPPNGPS